MKQAVLVFLSVSAILSHLAAEEVRQSIITNSPAFETAASPLRTAPAQEYEFSQAVLADVLRLLAHDSGISFFSLPSDADGADKLVTFNITSSPFKALETLATANGIALIYDAGIWYMRPANDRELIGRTYQIKYNALERVTGGGSTSGDTGGTGGTGGTGSGGGGAATSIDINAGGPAFEVEPSQLIEDIRELLDLQTTGFSATIAPLTSVDSLGQIGTAFTDAGIGNTSESDGGPSAKVIWNSDSNTLYIVASRQQHMWVEGYLASADTPQSLIALEVKFFETSRDPKEEFGLDWTGTLASGYNVNLTGISGSDIYDRLFNEGEFASPATAILSYEDVNVRLRALYDDRKTAAVSYPRMITLNNREVVLQSVINQPVLASSSATSLGAGATTTSSVSYLPIGTVVNLLPKEMSNGKIQLNISLTISSIIGEEVIDGNPFPIATSRVYNAPVQLESGYTVAIAGLEEARERDSESGVPILGKIPVLKTAFAWRDHSKSHNNLMILITPTLLDPNTEGIPDKPVSTLPKRPNPPPRPKVYSDGSLVRTTEELPTAITALSTEIQLFDQLAKEARATDETNARLGELYQACELTIQKVRLTMEQNPDSTDYLATYDNQLNELLNRMERLNRNLRRKSTDRKLPFLF